jgi:hypothetical protein
MSGMKIFALSRKSLTDDVGTQPGHGCEETEQERLPNSTSWGGCGCADGV